MSQNSGYFRPGELDGADIAVTDAERAESYATARELEQAIGAEPFHPPVGFANLVMAAVASEPAPRPAGFLAPLQAGHGLAGLVDSVRTAWSIALNGAGRPVGARGLALAYVLVVLLVGASLTGAAAYGAAGAMGLLAPDATPRPSLVAPRPTQAPDASSDASEPAGSEEPSGSIEPSESPDATESADPSASDQGQTSLPPGATTSPRESDDHGGPTESPGASDDHGGDSGSPDASDDATGFGPGSGPGSPTQSPRPTETPNPSD